MIVLARLTDAGHYGIFRTARLDCTYSELHSGCSKLLTYLRSVDVFFPYRRTVSFFSLFLFLLRALAFKNNFYPIITDATMNENEGSSFGRNYSLKGLRLS
jgi:hypothetical protein